MRSRSPPRNAAINSENCGRGRDHPGLRGQHLVWHGRAREDSARHCRCPEQGSERGAQRRKDHRPTFRDWRRADGRHAAEFSKLILTETEKWRKVVELSGAMSNNGCARNHISVDGSEPRPLFLGCKSCQPRQTRSCPMIQSQAEARRPAQPSLARGERPALVRPSLAPAPGRLRHHRLGRQAGDRA